MARRPAHRLQVRYPRHPDRLRRHTPPRRRLDPPLPHRRRRNELTPHQSAVSIHDFRATGTQDAAAGSTARAATPRSPAPPSSRCLNSMTSANKRHAKTYTDDTTNNNPQRTCLWLSTAQASSPRRHLLGSGGSGRSLTASARRFPAPIGGRPARVGAGAGGDVLVSVCGSSGDPVRRRRPNASGADRLAFHRTARVTGAVVDVGDDTPSAAR
jgi:hypothetical protein